MKNEWLFQIAYMDAAEPWQYGFQDAATPMMQGIIECAQVADLDCRALSNSATPSQAGPGQGCELHVRGMPSDRSCLKAARESRRTAH
jgi:hypothetical protein